MSTTMKEYTAIRHEKLHEHIWSVNAHIKEGWELYGNIAYEKGVFVQAMIKQKIR